MKKLLVRTAVHVVLAPILLLARIHLEAHFWWYGPIPADVILMYFMKGYRLDTDRHVRWLRKPREKRSPKKDHWIFALALPRSVCADVYRGCRREEERQRAWVEATRRD